MYYFVIQEYFSQMLVIPVGNEMIKIKPQHKNNTSHILSVGQ